LKTIAAAEIVTTSLKMPQIESVTTDVRWRRLECIVNTRKEEQRLVRGYELTQIRC
jgi:hypothetical protein